jgi:hypothetical protein
MIQITFLSLMIWADFLFGSLDQGKVKPAMSFKHKIQERDFTGRSFRPKSKKNFQEVLLDSMSKTQLAIYFLLLKTNSPS